MVRPLNAENPLVSRTSAFFNCKKKFNKSIKSFKKDKILTKKADNDNLCKGNACSFCILCL